MKSHTLVLLLSAPLLSASTPLLPSFSETLPDRPELSLLESVKSGQLPPLDAKTKATAEMFRRASTGERRFFSRMPVIVPNENVARNMPFVAPKENTDFKMIVKEPSVDSE